MLRIFVCHREQLMAISNKGNVLVWVALAEKEHDRPVETRENMLTSSSLHRDRERQT
jgi:hypothetical protein